VLCIYERCALFGIMGAGLVGAIALERLLISLSAG
jgi:disulfide bond formation protein DsbB